MFDVVLKTASRSKARFFIVPFLSLIYFHRRVNLPDESTCPGVSKGACVTNKTINMGYSHVATNELGTRTSYNAWPPRNRRQSFGGDNEVAR